MDNLILGTPGDDSLAGTPARDVIYAGSGDDRISNVGNGDVVWAGSGNDVVSTQPVVTVSGIRIEANVGHDTIVGRARESQVNADSGNDVVQINGCANDVVAGTGNDRYENPAACRGARRGSVSMGNGNDTVLLCYADQVNLGNGHDVLRAVRTIDVIRAGSGDDDVEFSLAVTTELFLGPGIDLLRLGGSTGVAVHAGNGADRVSGRALDSTIGGDDGSDLIELAALSARNALDGGPGRDHARLHRTSLATTCGRIERVTDPADKPRACA